MTTPTTAKPKLFSWRAFMFGAAVVVAIYAALAGWALLQSPITKAAIESELPQYATLIHRAEKPVDGTVDGNDTITPTIDGAIETTQPGETVTGDATTVPPATSETVGATETVSNTTPEQTTANTDGVTPETTTETTPETTATTPDSANETITEPAATEQTTTPPTTTPTETATIESMENSMAVAPAPGLVQNTENGPLPIVRDGDRLRPFDAYRRPFRPTASSTAPIISIVINDIGLSDALSTSAIDTLPADISFGITPYATDPNEWITRARAAGHEAWITLPVETADYPLSDPGPQTLLIGAIEKQNINKLHWVLSRGTGYVGVLTGRNPAFIKSLNDMRPVLSDVYRRGLGFVDGDTSAGDVPRTMAVGLNAPYSNANAWIDNTQTPEAINEALANLERIAANHGSAIGFADASPLTVKAIAEWAKTLQGKGLVLAPLSAATRASQ